MEKNKEILQFAIEASKKAYCPYSKFPVGACAMYENGKIYTGCNIENSSYGLSLCAERNAMSTAIAMGETSKLVKIAIYSPKTKQCFPCGACRQWIQEFAKGYNTEIILEGENNDIKIYHINEILPYPFEIL